ncbi:MAG: CpaD family pilus assembly protein [Alphaproteobacteria bacterium]|nr:CpaD family pilus assembly protein [Alphaproteobacteria bacterium]MDX5369843.1 CpaD family pilus assembly protein [Alphaproteobacteria bacterium]MDX5464459.1 CpaD family pilus assembly protein [Alphaproteobacteria bacterium]
MQRTTNFRCVLLGLAGLAALGAAGCAGPNGAEQAVTPQARHPITVTRVDNALDIAVETGPFSLTPAEENRLKAFGQNYLVSGHGPLKIATPRGSANAGAARAATSRIVRLMDESGVSQDAIEIVSYEAQKGAADAPVRLSFERYVAEGSPCRGQWSTNTASNPRNEMTPGFGCASQHNLAAMISDPADLVRPRVVTDADAQRRDFMFDLYRQGQSPGAERSAAETATTTD